MGRSYPRWGSQPPRGTAGRSPGLMEVFVDPGCDAAAGSEGRLNMEISALANVVVMRALFLARLLRR